MATRAPASKPFITLRRRVIIENLTAYAFLLPAAVLIFVFEFFPVAFAFFVSLHDWRRFPDEFRGLDAYHEAIGNFAFVIFFWLAIGFIGYGVFVGLRYLRETAKERRGLVYLLPGAALAAALLGAVYWVFTVLPIIMDVVRRLRGTATTTNSFVAEFFNSFTFPQAVAAGNIALLALAAAAVVVPLTLRLVRSRHSGRYLMLVMSALVLIIGGGLLLWLTVSEVQAAIMEAREDGEILPIWTQVVIVSAGAALIGGAALWWQRAVHNMRSGAFWPRGLLIAMMIVGGVLLVMQMPQVLSKADDDVLRGFLVTAMYSFFSVPLQLSIGLLLAVMLFQEIRFKSFFRVIFFMPYITPIVATSVVFSLIFSPDPQSPINQFLNLWGIEDQLWLLEPKGVFQLIFGDIVPDVLAGPGLALVVIILFGVWTYAGYSTVIFLAGLGNIDPELYEAAEIDGANGWQRFRYVTLPLLSPTTFFLILITTIGTLQAFTQIFLMRRPGAYDAVDTINIHIFNEVRTASPDYAYGSAMAFVLFAVILILTIIQNRVVGRRVFYG